MNIQNGLAMASSNQLKVHLLQKKHSFIGEKKTCGTFAVCLFSITLSLSQCPLLVIIKVRVSSDPWPRSKGVSQETIFAIEGVAIAVLC